MCAQQSYNLTDVPGWYNMCQRGYLHRDISIRNVLMSGTDYEAGPMKLYPDGSESNNILRDRLDRVLKKLKIHDRCKGGMIDADFGIDWNLYFGYAHVETRSVSLHGARNECLLLTAFTFISGLSGNTAVHVEQASPKLGEQDALPSLASR